MASPLEQVAAAIEQANQHEAKNGTLKTYLEAQRHELHSAVAIPPESPTTALLAFVVDYVQAVPEHLQALYTLSSEAGISNYVDPILNLTTTFMLNPPDILNKYEGLHGMLCKAYIAHRIMEELNDQVMSLGGAALAPMDMSFANIIAHELIGGDFSNQLDHLVLLTIETTDCDKTVFKLPTVIDFMKKRSFLGWEDVLKQWPCFTKECGIDLQLGH